MKGNVARLDGDPFENRNLLVVITSGEMVSRVEVKHFEPPKRGQPSLAGPSVRY